MQISEAAGGIPAAGLEPCRFPKLEECAHFHYERVQLPHLTVTLQTNNSMDQSLLHSQHATEDEDNGIDWHMVQVTSADECWLVQRSYENFKMLDAQLHQCIYDRKISQLPDLANRPSYGEDIETLLIEYLARFSSVADNSVNCGPVLNWFQMDNKGHRLLVPSEESRSINTPAVAAAYSVRRYVSQARDELNLEVGDMISVIDMASPAESMWWRGKRGFQVGFFPQHCVHIIGDKVPRNMPLPPPVVGSLALTPVKPVLRKHGKLIAFFRSFILNRPSRRRLKQSGILKERVFGCDLGEHLLNSGHDIPTVLKCCAEFIEKHGIVDGIYRLSGVTSNIQKLRNAFDEDRIPDLYTEDILQDIHSVASLLKMYFRELPNPLCTYQLYQSFVTAVQGCSNVHRNSLSDRDRLLKMREAVQKLPPPHYRTLEYLMRHLSRVAQHGPSTGMTTRNIAIVWAPNLLRCAELEVGGVAALQGVGVQAVVTEFLICYADLIFCDHLPSLNRTNFDAADLSSLSPKRNRPKSLAISTPTKLITLEEARTKHLLSKTDESGYIEVGGGPDNLPKKYHTVIELPSGSRKRGLSKRSPLGWRSFFSKSRSSSRSQGSLTKNRKASTPGNIASDKCVTESDLSEMKRKLRPVKSAESLTSGHSEPASTEDVLGPLHCLNKPTGHNRSVSHDSYFDTLQSSQHNSEGSLYDLSEIQLNFELEESEMRIFSEDESLVSSPRVQRDAAAAAHRRLLTRARPEDFSSANNSNNPSPKKQARVVLSPDSNSRKRTRLEDQLSDIQYIDCNTPDNMCTIVSTTAVVHTQPETVNNVESYQPKNKSPRNSEIETVKRQSLDLEKVEKPAAAIPKSFTEANICGGGGGGGSIKLVIPSNQSSTFASPQSPIYKQLDDSSSNTTPLVSPDFSPTTSVEVNYHNLNRYSSDENEKTVTNGSKSVYENVGKKSNSPTYENVLTTISITYRPKSTEIRACGNENDDSVYEDVQVLNPEQAVVPTSVASLPLQQASQPDFQKDHLSSSTAKARNYTSLPDNFSVIVTDFNANGRNLTSHSGRDGGGGGGGSILSLPDVKEQRPKSLSALEDLDKTEDSSSLRAISKRSPTPLSYNYKSEQLLSLTDLSLSEVVHSSTTDSQSSISFPIGSPGKNSLSSPVVSPILFCDGTKTLSQDILTSLSPDVASLLEARSRHSSGSSLIDDNVTDCFLRTDARHGNPEYLKLTDNNISSNEEDVSPVRFRNTALLAEEVPPKTGSTEKLIETGPNSHSGIDESDGLSTVGAPDLNLDVSTPTSIDLIEFSPNEPPPETTERLNPSNDKRKSCETESLDDETSIYQQVKYFRRSVHEINALLDLQAGNDDQIVPETHETKDESPVDDGEVDNYDSLEIENVHIYENVENEPPVEPEPAKPTVRSLTSQFESREVHQKPPSSHRRTNPSPSPPARRDKSITTTTDSRCDLSASSLSLENDRVQKTMVVYERGSLPPCLRARHVKNAIKTRSLDEDAFAKEFGVDGSQPSSSTARRKSVDENFGSKLNTLRPKQLNQPKPIPVDAQKLDVIHMAHSAETVFPLNPEQKLNRERIEKYKEERRKFLHDKYRSESFKEDKDILLSRFKQKMVKHKTSEGEKTNDCSGEGKEPTAGDRTANETQTHLVAIETETKAELSRLDCEVRNKIEPKQPGGGNKTVTNENIRHKTALFEGAGKQSTVDRCNFQQNKVQAHKSQVEVSKTIENNCGGADVLEFVRARRRDDLVVTYGSGGGGSNKGERRRHTFETRDRERDLDADRVRRISLENQNARKDTKSPPSSSSYCIKDMKAIFESKSQQ